MFAHIIEQQNLDTIINGDWKVDPHFTSLLKTEAASCVDA